MDVFIFCLIFVVKFYLINLGILFISFFVNVLENRRRKISCMEIYGIFLFVL